MTSTRAPNRRLLLLGLLSVTLLWASCSSTSERAADAPAAPALEESVHPGINESYEDAEPAEWVERFEREGREIFDLRAAIVDACRIELGTEMADVGTGTGLLLPLFSAAVGRDGRVYAVDIVPSFLGHIEQRLTAEGIDNVETVLCTERSIELPPSSVDLVFCCDTYHHFEYPRSTLASIRDALRPGGRFVVVDFERIPGKSSDWILDHVRADRETATSEIQSAGFKLDRKVEGLLKDNWFSVFRKN